jgi:hypothetical protein
LTPWRGGSSLRKPSPEAPIFGKSYEPESKPKKGRGGSERRTKFCTLLTHRTTGEKIKMTHRSEEARDEGLVDWFKAGYTPVYWTTESWSCIDEEPPSV